MSFFWANARSRLRCNRSTVNPLFARSLHLFEHHRVSSHVCPSLFFWVFYYHQFASWPNIDAEHLCCHVMPMIMPMPHLQYLSLFSPSKVIFLVAQPYSNALNVTILSFSLQLRDREYQISKGMDLGCRSGPSYFSL